jgi:hypothetical protein
MKPIRRTMFGILMIVICILIVSTACGSTQEEPQGAPNDIEEVEEASTLENEESIVEEESAESDPEMTEGEIYTEPPPYLVLETVQVGENISYPKVTQFEGELLKGYINQSLKNVYNKYLKMETAKDMMLNYVVTKNTSDVLSVVYSGVIDDKNEGMIEIVDSVNIDMSGSLNEITYDNLVMDKVGLSQKLENEGLLPPEMKLIDQKEVRLFYSGDKVFFFFKQSDDVNSEYFELPVEESLIKEFLATDFGDRVAS